MSDVPRDPPVDGEANPDDLPEDHELDELLDGDEPAEEPAEGETEEEEPEGQAQPEVRPRRGPSRQARLSRENTELRERLARVEGRLDAPRPQAPQFDPEAQRRADEEFYERLRNEGIDPVEATRRITERVANRERQAFGGVVLQMQNDADRRDFAALARSDRNAARFRDEVEEIAGQIVRTGNVPNREVIFERLLGREVRQRASRVVAPQRRAAAGRVARETTRANGGGGDVARSQGRSRNQDDADEALLRNLRAGDL